MPSAIHTQDLAKGYGRTQALHPLTLDVPAGAVFALVGHNGAGKTTLIKLLMNMIHPTSGTATILGRDTATLTGEDFTRIAYASENQELPDWMTVGQFLSYLKGFYPTWDDAALVQQLELPLDRKLKHLSRGMLMKAALASILAFKPSIILLDEPFSGLDPLVRDELIEALMVRVRPRSLAGSEALSAVPDADRPTILISSHDLAEVESFATHIGFLHQGRLLFAEEMTTLTSRFREITLTLPPPAPGEPTITLPTATGVPDSWLLLEQTLTAARFVHTHADTESIPAQVAAVFPTPYAPDIQVAPMTLRAIFLALAKSGRAPAVPA
ncbi:ABC transporter ATP-binding protein [Granulicella tundricola]|uniref:ABC transporter related protein n=1 Tax=Granulicella tundricola (strain ATCC BAA-1859 / DSM 23138 / MP5ACTX9) TaxID=1198114 RepID=E8X0J1_GRATM|nr:ABC transporter ATP-binding protein [Granulicella tundricola]ADW67855.1 ABC transporter related protein [Granulicella tundricola MP5ACTX9]